MADKEIKLKISVEDKDLDATEKRLNAVGSAAGIFAHVVGSFIGGTLSGMFQELTAQLSQLPSTFINLTKQFAEMGSEIADTSSKLGLGAEALSTIRQAALLSGSSLKDFETGFAAFEKRLAEGGKKTSQIFKDFGIDAKEGLKNPEAAFSKFLETFSGIQDAGKRTALAMNLFGRSGADLIPTFDALGTSFEMAKEKAKLFGTTISDEAAAKADAMGDALDNLGMIASGVGNRFVAEFADNITKAMVMSGDVMITTVDVMIGQLHDFESTGEQTSTNFIKSFGKIIVQIQPILKTLGYAVLSAGATVAFGVTGILGGFVKAIELIAQFAIIPINKIIEAINQIKEFTGGEKFSPIIVDFGGDALLAQAQKAYNDIFELFKKAQQSEISRLDALNEYELMYNETIRKRTELESKQAKAREDAIKRLKDLQEKGSFDLDSAKGNKKASSSDKNELHLHKDAQDVFNRFNRIMETQPQFLPKLEAIAESLNTNPEWILNVLAMESRLRADAKNPTSTATGLFQMIDNGKKGDGIYEYGGRSLTRKQIAAMSATEQLPLLFDYLSPFKNQLTSQSAVYAAIAAGRVGGENSVFFTKGSEAYGKNRVWDVNKDGRITQKELGAVASQFGFGNAYKLPGRKDIEEMSKERLSTTGELMKDVISERQLDSQSQYILGLEESYKINERSQALNDKQLYYQENINAKIVDYNVSLKEQMQDLIIEQEVLKARDKFAEAQVEYQKQANAQISETLDIERDLLVLKAQSLDEEFVKQRRNLSTKKEEYDLQKEITNLQDELANFDVNQGLKTQVEYLQTILDLRREQRELSNKDVFNPVQAELQLTSYLNQNIKSVTQRMVDFKTTIADGFFQQIDSPFERLRQKLEKLPPIISGLASAFVNFANDLVRAFSQKIIQQLFGFGGQTSNQNGQGFSFGNLFKGLFNSGNNGISVGGFSGGTYSFPSVSLAGIGSSSNFNSFLGSSGGSGFSSLDTSGTRDRIVGNLPINDITSQVSSYTKFKQLFSGKGNLLGSIAPLIGMSIGSGLGANSQLGSVLGSVGGLGLGILGGVATGALNAGTMLGGVFGAGGALSIGGLSAAMSATVVLAPIAAALMIGSWLIGRNKQRRTDEVTRDKLMTDTLSQLTAIKTEMTEAKVGISVDSLLDDAKQISANYFAQANQLKDKKTRNIAIKDGRERVGMYPLETQYPSALLNQIYAASEAARLKEQVRAYAGEQDRRLIPQFASGAFIPAKNGGHLAVVGEGGYDEFILSTDPRHQARTAQLLRSFLDRMNFKTPKMAAGGASSGVSVANIGGSKQPIIVNIYTQNSGMVESDIVDIVVESYDEPDVQVKLLETVNKTKSRERK